MSAATPTFTPEERDYVRRELDVFSTFPTVAEGFQLKMAGWHPGGTALSWLLIRAADTRQAAPAVEGGLAATAEWLSWVKPVRQSEVSKP